MAVAAASSPVALYVHVPFCLSVCPYCDFVVVAGRAARSGEGSVERFLAAVEAELQMRADRLDVELGASRPPLQSLYLGGGTPSLLPASAVARLLSLVAERFGLSDGAEITLEANPGPSDRGDIEGFARAGVTRLSIGAQSLLDRELPRLGRRHRAADVVETGRVARAAGIGSVSLDLLSDVPRSSVDDFAASLDRALALEPDHLSIYALALGDPEAEGLTGTLGDHRPPKPGARRWRARAARDQDEDRAAAMYELATDRLAAAGYRGYEISNWARPGHESRHNLAYWRREPYEAVGPGAHAFDGTTRRWNAAPLEPYLDGLAPRDGSAPALPPGGSERLDDATAALERVILGLRLDTGLEPGAAGAPPLGPHLGWGRAMGLLATTAEGRIALTTRGRLLSNELFARLV